MADRPRTLEALKGKGLVAVLAGADDVVSPVSHCDVVTTCNRYSVAVIPGVMTIVKIFPAGVGAAVLQRPDGAAPLHRNHACWGDRPQNRPGFIQAGPCGVGWAGNWRAGP